MSTRRLLPLLCIVLALGAVSSAGATTPGPNGRIAFTINDGHGTSELYSANADGSAQRRLTWTPQTEQAPAWSPDGTRIAYESSLGGRFRIWVMKADGSAQTQLTSSTGSTVDDADPSWSPDGTQIAFGSTRSGNWNLWVINADGSGLRRVSTVFGDDPAWSPDGRRLAYLGMDGIGVVGVDGSDPHVVTAPGAPAAGPSWSPDGTQIVFSRNNPAGYAGELYVANADGSGEHLLTSDGYSNARATWSPDGAQIVFQRTTTPPFGWSLWAIGVDGTGLRRVTSSDNSITPDWGSSLVVPEPLPPDAPLIQIYSPDPGRIYLPTSPTPAFYECSSYVSYIVSCDGDVPSGAQLDLVQAGTHTFTVRAVDAEGHTATASVTYFVFDIVPPKIELRTPADGATYELGSNVTVDYACTDPNGTGVVYCAGDRPAGYPLDTSQTGVHSFTVNALDNSRNFSQATATYTVVDHLPPTIQISSPSNGATYSLGETVLAAYSCNSASDSHLVTCAGPVANGGTLDTRSAGAKTFTVNASDDRGKTTSMTSTYTVVDRRPPTIQISSPSNGATYTLGETVLAAYSCHSASDGHLVTCSGPVADGSALDTRSVGARTFTVTASDDGKTASMTSTYAVLYAFTGFDSPVLPSGSIDTAKAGDSVPLKFSLRGNQGLGIVTRVTWQAVSCTDWSALGAAATAQAKLSYSASTDRYADIVASDSSWKGTCRTVDLELADGTHHAVRVHFTK